MKSSGATGELAATYAFRQRGWTMFRSQPEVNIIRSLGKGKFVVNFRRGGIADFTGYSRNHQYIACEVKECTGNSMPASRLHKEQRDWMSCLKPGMAWVAIYWVNHTKVTIHPFIPKGSYKYENCG